MTKIEIKSTEGKVLFAFESEDNTIAKTLEKAIAQSADLSDAVLYDADLRDADLSNADLSGADLKNADLSDANLKGAVLRNADLGHANLRNANLRNADLRNADLRNADLRNADLSYANLRNADLSNAVLDDADLSGDVNSNKKVIKEEIIEYLNGIVLWAAFMFSTASCNVIKINYTYLIQWFIFYTCIYAMFRFVSYYINAIRK
jgi:uncharacterized protein YjbI with pentapeptide repeats